MELKTSSQIKIYRDGQLDRWATFKPILKNKASNLFQKVDYFIVHNKWPVQLDD